VCLGSQLDSADAMRNRLRDIWGAEPTVFHYCCARGTQNPPAAPAKKLQRLEFLRLLWRRYSLCSGVALLHPLRTKQLGLRQHGLYGFLLQVWGEEPCLLRLRFTDQHVLHMQWIAKS